MEASFSRCKAIKVAVEGRDLEWSARDSPMTGDFDFETSANKI